MTNIQKHASSSTETVLLGNKVDLRTSGDDGGRRCVESSDGQAIATQYQLDYFETSAKAATNVQAAFEAITRKALRIRQGNSGDDGPSSDATSAAAHAPAPVSPRSRWNKDGTKKVLGIKRAAKKMGCAIA